MGGNAALFSVATALIPGLFFGGALIERRAELSDRFPSRFAGLVVGGFVLTGVAAEIMAIRGSIEPNISRFEQRFVVFVLVAGTIAIALVSAAPWVSQFRRQARVSAIRAHDETQSYLGRRTETYLGWRWAWPVAIIVGGSLFAQVAITNSLDDANARDGWNEASQRLQRTNRTLDNAEAAADTARGSLLTTGRHVRPALRRRAGPAIASYLDVLGASPCNPSLYRLSEKASQVAASAAISCVHDAAQRFTTTIRSTGDSGRTADGELLRLAGNRVMRTAVTRVVALENAGIAKRIYDEACDAARRIGCVTPRRR